ncbi:MAG: MATE family efflux transporter [Pseudomonadota bacterium]
MASRVQSQSPITHRRVLAIAAPIVLSNATVPILGAVDTGVVGQMGEAAPIGAVAVGAMIVTFSYWLFGFLRMGTAGLAAQAIGAGDDDEATALLMRGLLIAAVAGGAVILLQWPIVELGLLAVSSSPEVEEMARAYASIRLFSAPAAIAVFAVTGWMIAAERTGQVLILQLWMNGLNIALDLLFVLGLGWEVEGVAIATLIAEWSGALLGLWLLRACFRGTAWRDRALILRADRLRRMMAVNGDILIRTLLLQIGFALFTIRSAAQGEVNLAANHVLLNFLYIIAHALDGFAFAAEALVGQSLGARNRARLRRAALMCGFWGMVVSLLLALAFLLGGPAIIEIMTTSPDVRAAAMAFLVWLVISAPVSLPSFMLDGVFIGATRTRDMRNAMIVSLGVYLVALFTLPDLMGNHGLWAAMTILFIARAATLAVKYPALEAEADAK